MKRLTALALCLLLTLSCVLAQADVNATSYTQEEKLLLQLQTSGFNAALSFAAAGEPVGGMDASTWALLKTLLPTLSVNLSRTVQRGNAKNGEENILTVLSGENPLTSVSYLTDANGLSYVKSPLISDSELYYAFEKGFDLTRLMTDALSGNDWPSIWHILYAVNTADEAWQARAQTAITPYLTKVTAWMQTYASTTSEKDVNGGFITTIAYQIPAAAVLQETKQLLVDFFSDATLLSLLREVLTSEEQAAYLQPTMLLSFLQMLDNVKLEGMIQIKRQYDLAGTPLYESVLLPFADNFSLESLSILTVPGETGENVSVRGAFRDMEGAALSGVGFDVGLVSGESGIYTGQVTLTLPPTEGDFTVTEEASADRTVSFAYNLYLAEPLDTADALNNRWERKYEATLLVKPDEKTGLAPLSFGLKTQVYSKSSAKTSVTHVEGALTVTDMNTEGSLTATLSGKTTKAWTPTLIDGAQTSALRVDLMETGARQALIKQLTEQLGASLQKLLTQALLPAIPQPTDGTLG